MIVHDQLVATRHRDRRHLLGDIANEARRIHRREPRRERAVLAAHDVQEVLRHTMDRLGGSVNSMPAIAIAGHLVYDGPAGGPVPFDREAARVAMSAAEVLIRLDLGLGDGSGEGFGCDLTEEYVRENSEFTDGRIPKARHVPLGQLKNRLPELEKFKGKPVVDL